MTALSHIQYFLGANSPTGFYSLYDHLLSPEAEIDGYGEDVSAYVSMTCIDCTVSGGEEPLTATASVKHRLGGEDSYTFLTIGLTWREGRWQADWAGLEK